MFFLAAMLCFGINDVKAQNVGDIFYIEYENYVLGFSVTKINPTPEVCVTCAEQPYEETQLFIPNTVTDDNGINYTVTSIYENGFSGMPFIGELQLPSSLKSIDVSAFNGCDGLTGEIIIPSNVTSISPSAFANCSNINSLTILSNKLSTISEECFSGCKKLSKVVLSNSVKFINYKAFNNCPITDIVFSTNLISIGTQAFYGFKMSKLILPSKLTSIGELSFASNQSLTEVIISSSITEIGKNAFKQTQNLVTVRCNSTTAALLGENGFGALIGFSTVNDNLKIYVPACSYDEYVSADNWYDYRDYIEALPTFVEDGSLNNGDNWVPNGVPASNTDVFINAKATIGSTESFTTNTFGICKDGKITIEEGGQLIHNGSEDVVTVKKSIAPYVIGEDGYLASGWYTISSPFGDLQLSSSNFLKNNYELFRYNESIYEWENHKNPEHVNDFTTLEAGRGYIYANAKATNISITEKLNTENKSHKMTASGEYLTGFNLVGNPFMHNIYKGSGCAIDNGNLAEGFYTLSNEGAWHAKHNDPIKPMESILVKTTTAGTLYINKKTNSSAARALNNGLVTINVSNEKHNDVAYVTFNGGIGLDKINHRNSSIPMVYVPVDNVNYAIAVMDKEVTEIPVSFEAMSMGEYTISVSSTACNYDKITLIDKQTGEETNMLAGDYKFLATTNDNPERFLIKVSINENTEAEFFTDGSSIIINNIEGSGVVQIFDVMGRLVIKQNTNDSNCQISSSEMANGVYVISLTDDNGTTTKKILINNK